MSIGILVIRYEYLRISLKLRNILLKYKTNAIELMNNFFSEFLFLGIIFMTKNPRKQNPWFYKILLLNVTLVMNKLKTRKVNLLKVYKKV